MARLWGYYGCRRLTKMIWEVLSMAIEHNMLCIVVLRPFDKVTGNHQKHFRSSSSYTAAVLRTPLSNPHFRIPTLSPSLSIPSLPNPPFSNPHFPTPHFRTPIMCLQSTSAYEAILSEVGAAPGSSQTPERASAWLEATVNSGNALAEWADASVEIPMDRGGGVDKAGALLEQAERR
jgi:hypothetical protein